MNDHKHAIIDRHLRTSRVARTPPTENGAPQDLPKDVRAAVDEAQSDNKWARATVMENRHAVYPCMRIVHPSFFCSHSYNKFHSFDARI